MIINYQRREELKKFAEEFKLKMKLADDNIKNSCNISKKIPDINDEYGSNTPEINTSNSKVLKVERKPSPLWVPNKFNGDYFNKFVGMSPGKEITCWERERINLIERSYAKESSKIHWTPPGNKKIIQIFPDENCLTQLGKNIIGKFRSENERLELKRKQEDEYYENLKHSKHPIFINPWKYNSKYELFSHYKILKRTESYSKNNNVMPRLSGDIKFN